LQQMKYLVTADIHGSITTWLTLKALMKPEDVMVIAGDLFDTRYGNFSHPDFAPEAIRQDLSGMRRKFYYVYGNCDVPAFFPGYDHSLTFIAEHKKIFLHHGHNRGRITSDADIIIQGHTHVWCLEKHQGKIFLNPGSISRPKKGGATYGIIDNRSVCIMDLKTGTPIASLDI
jgi:uncharacterized protein